MRNPTNGQYSIGRILLVSPEQNEMVRRNYSRIFIAPTGEGVIDSILFQSFRPVESFMGVAARAIQMAGLHSSDGELSLKALSNPHVTGGFLQEHLITTSGWLENEDNVLYDMWIEVLPENEKLPGNLDITTYNAETIDGFENENPLVIAVDVENLQSHGASEDSENLDQNQTQNTDTTSQDSDNSNQEKVDESASVEGSTGNRGRVTNPETDRRLKRNRDNNGAAMARRDEAEHSENNGGRMAGHPGRVKDRRFDFRLKQNRGIPVTADAGGR